MENNIFFFFFFFFFFNFSAISFFFFVFLLLLLFIFHNIFLFLFIYFIKIILIFFLIQKKKKKKRRKDLNIPEITSSYSYNNNINISDTKNLNNMESNQYIREERRRKSRRRSYIDFARGINSSNKMTFFQQTAFYNSKSYSGYIKRKYFYFLFLFLILILILLIYFILGGLPLPLTENDMSIQEMDAFPSINKELYLYYRNQILFSWKKSDKQSFIKVEDISINITKTEVKNNLNIIILLINYILFLIIY